MRTLSNALSIELGLTSTRPGYLIELLYAAPSRFSTMGDVSWAGQNWDSTSSVKVSGIGNDGTGNSSGTLALTNTQNDFGALILQPGGATVNVNIWAYYAGATDTDDPVRVFAGAMDGATIDPHVVTLNLVPFGNRTFFSPRVFINKQAGFNFLQPVGTKITVNGEIFVLERP